jgi:hypothetical protein
MRFRRVAHDHATGDIDNVVVCRGGVEARVTVVQNRYLNTGVRHEQPRLRNLREAAVPLVVPEELHLGQRGMPSWLPPFDGGNVGGGCDNRMTN